MALALELKEGTKKSHSAAENTKFVGAFLRGVLNPEEYRNLLAQFYYVYSTMETAIRGSNDERVKQVYYPELERVAVSYTHLTLPTSDLV